MLVRQPGVWRLELDTIQQDFALLFVNSLHFTMETKSYIGGSRHCPHYSATLGHGTDCPVWLGN